jgi:hypothetical protein
MEADNIEISLHIHPEATNSISNSLLDEKVRNFQEELRVLRHLSVNPAPASQAAPPGSMSGDVFTIGALLIATLPTVLPALLEMISNWKTRNAGLTVTIKRQSSSEGQSIEITIPERMTKAQIQEYLDLLNQNLSTNRDAS